MYYWVWRCCEAVNWVKLGASSPTVKAIRYQNRLWNRIYVFSSSCVTKVKCQIRVTRCIRPMGALSWGSIKQCSVYFSPNMIYSRLSRNGRVANRSRSCNLRDGFISAPKSFGPGFTEIFADGTGDISFLVCQAVTQFSISQQPSFPLFIKWANLVHLNLILTAVAVSS